MKRIAIANRGEIALRLMRTFKDLGIETVILHSEADAHSLPVLFADSAICIGPAASQLSYLNHDNVLTGYFQSRADGLHLGYGYLSEDVEFSKKCQDLGVHCIGPSFFSMEALGDKSKAKAIAKKVGCPTPVGSEGVVDTVFGALTVATEIGFPVYIKATHGGGGKGIRYVESRESFESSWFSCKKEALASFSCDDLYLEKAVLNPKHIEIQVISDKYGDFIHLGERDCSPQRRKQKLVEETPSVHVNEVLRQQMGAAAISVVKEVGYYSLATVEFLLDESGAFYFLEVNTRIQVEHTVTELAYGVDLVAIQIAIANGATLSSLSIPKKRMQHAMEFRINAEDPSCNFRPSPGFIKEYLPPLGPHIRFDSALFTGIEITPHYDSLIAKLIVAGATREEVIARSKRALDECIIAPLNTTVSFHKWILSNSQFLDGSFTIGTIDEISNTKSFKEELLSITSRGS